MAYTDSRGASVSKQVEAAACPLCISRALSFQPQRVLALTGADASDAVDVDWIEEPAAADGGWR